MMFKQLITNYKNSKFIKNKNYLTKMLPLKIYLVYFLFVRI